MKRSNKLSIFGLSFLCGLLIMLTVLFWNRPRPHPWKKARALSRDIFVTEQIKENDVRDIARGKFATIIDLRPDGEAPDQAPAAAIEKQTHIEGLEFVYIPVPHGPIPEDAVTKLGDAVARNPKPILLYCRSGKRAARTFGLAEASRPNGPDAQEILAMVKSAGQSADDLSDDINKRIAERMQNRGGSR